jgi:small subunit ribosomal protein S3
MGRKVHPYGFRLGVSRTWTAKWYADKEYTSLLKEDITIRKLVERRKVKLEIKEIRQPELDAHLVAMNIAGQLTRRIAFKKAMKQAIQRSMKAGAKGVRIAVSGRLGGSEMGRREWDREGRIPLGTLRADISYGQVHAHTTYGRIGVKVWIYRGDIAPERQLPHEANAAGAPAAVGQGG